MDNNIILEKRQYLLDNLTSIERRISGLEKYPALIKIASKLLRRTAKYFYFIQPTAGLFSTRPAVRTFWGEKIFIHPIGNRPSCLHLFGTLNFPETKLIKFIIRNLKPKDVFYDIGANCGFYSMLAGFLLRESGETHAFEPHSEVFGLLSKNIKNLSGKIFINDAALGETSGEIDFYKADGVHATQSTTSPVVAAHIGDYRLTRVKALTLDDYCQKHTPPSFIKLDTEGGETEIIRGGWEIIKKHQPVVSLEIWQKQRVISSLSRTAADLLRQLGYQPHWLDANGNPKLITFDELGCFSGPFDNYVFIHGDSSI